MTYTGLLPSAAEPRPTNSDREAVANVNEIVAEVMGLLGVLPAESVTV